MSNDIKNAFYLASSWLWCIGAFFPLILIHDYGGVALVAFAVVNICGATWFGYYFKNGSDKEFRQRNRASLNIFSIVTITFQVFFIGWLTRVTGLDMLLAVFVALIVLFIVCRRFIVEMSVLVFIISIGLFISFYQSNTPSLPPIDITKNTFHIIIPMVLGFMLSPYLDLTFHRAYQNSDNPKLTFTLGFAVLFLCLLLFVFYYADALSNLFFSQQSSSLLYPVFGFIVLQTAYTVSAHTIEILRFNEGTAQRVMTTLGISIIATIAMVLVLKWVPALPLVQQVSLAELIYKSFLSCFSLIFPIILLFPNKRLMAFLLCICIMPLSFMAFIVDVKYSYLLSVAMMLLVSTWLISHRTSSRSQVNL